MWALRQWLRARSIAKECREAAAEYQRTRLQGVMDVDETVAKEAAEASAGLTAEPAAEAAKTEDNAIAKLNDKLATGPTAVLVAKARARAIARAITGADEETSAANVETDPGTFSEFLHKAPQNKNSSYITLQSGQRHTDSSSPWAASTPLIIATSLVSPLTPTTSLNLYVKAY